ncbi:hypothetical protein KAZ01_03400 [Candidatus Gracilibacteria bacterium]|nr:hypothetical protein [Candidatus Gracilibacteria bacterium]
MDITPTLEVYPNSDSDINKLYDIQKEGNTMHKFDKKKFTSQILNILDYILFFVFICLLIILIATSTNINLFADSVDYYGILQWLTPEKEKPIVSNLYFAEQRSPGYSLLSLIPYSLLTVFVEPFVTTEKVSEYKPPYLDFPKEMVKRVAGSEKIFLPPQPLHIKDLFFKDYYISSEDSWYQWKLALSLLLTSFFFLFIGLWANSKVLNLYYPASKCLFIIPITLLTSSMLIISILNLPLFATLTYYGLSSLFLLFICLSFRSNKGLYVILSGFILGLLVLTRLELSIFVFLLIGYFLFTKRKRFLLFLCLGGLAPFIVLVIYNLSFFGIPLHLGILKGDINTLGLNWRYIFENLIHPESGVLFWTPLLIPWLLFLITTKDSILKVIGFCSFILIIFYTLRIPIMYYHIGQGVINIGGIPVTVPGTPIEMRELIRFDINRYVCVLIPFSILGISIGIHKIHNLLIKKYAK